MNASDETKPAGNRQIIPFVNEEAGIALQDRRERVAINTAAVYFMRPVYQWLNDLLAIVANSMGLATISPLLAYSIAQSSINPTNASITVWRMMTAEGEDELRLRSVINAVQTYRSPDNVADRSLGTDAFIESFTEWLNEINQPDGPDLMDLPQFLLGPIAVMCDNKIPMAEWMITAMGAHGENRNFYMVTLQRWDLQMDILIDYRELASLAILIQMCNADEEDLEPVEEAAVDTVH